MEPLPTPHGLAAGKCGRAGLGRAGPPLSQAGGRFVNALHPQKSWIRGACHEGQMQRWSMVWGPHGCVPSAHPRGPHTMDLMPRITGGVAAPDAHGAGPILGPLLPPPLCTEAGAAPVLGGEHHAAISHAVSHAPRPAATCTDRPEGRWCCCSCCRHAHVCISGVACLAVMSSAPQQSRALGNPLPTPLLAATLLRYLPCPQDERSGWAQVTVGLLRALLVVYVPQVLVGLFHLLIPLGEASSCCSGQRGC